MLLMIAKPRPTPGDRARAVAARAGRALLDSAGAALSWPFEVAEHRRLRSALAAMGDRALRDIGLSRGDVADAVALPATRDPGRFLAARRDERRGRA